MLIFEDAIRRMRYVLADETPSEAWTILAECKASDSIIDIERTERQ